MNRFVPEAADGRAGFRGVWHQPTTHRKRLMTTISEQNDSTHPRAGQSAPERAGDWAVEVHGLSKRFGTQVAVDDVDLLVPRGSAFGYLGPNGAGKTTLIRVQIGRASC